MPFRRCTAAPAKGMLQTSDAANGNVEQLHLLGKR